MTAKQMELCLTAMKQEEAQFYQCNRHKMESLHPNADSLCEIHSQMLQEIQELEQEITAAYLEEETAEDERKEAIRLREVPAF